MHKIFDDKVIVKIKYGDHLYNITWDIKKKLSYKKLFQFLGKSFKIKKDDIKYLELSDEHGRVYEKSTLEYYIRLCPKLDKIFHLKINYRKRMSPAKQTNTIAQEIFNDTEKAKVNISLKYKSKRCEDATPVFRQNCFIGQLPIYEPGTPVFRQNCFIGELPNFGDSGGSCDIASYNNPIIKRQRINFKRQRYVRI